MIIEIIIIAVVILLVVSVRVLSRPLPPWNGLVGDEYKKYKEGGIGKSDNSD